MPDVPLPSTVQLTEADDGRSIDLRVGDTLAITLPGNPTTGFKWEPGAPAPAILRPRGGTEFKPISSGMGSAGQVTLRFDAASAGQAELTLVYHRPFEKNVPPAKTFRLRVSVK